MNEFNEKHEEAGNKQIRHLSIDVFKGISILLMVFVNTVGFFDNTPAWSKHAIDYGLTYVDLIAPFFIFMMALNFKPSYQRRLKKKGRLKTYLYFFWKFLLYIGIGLVLSMNVDSSGISFRWGVFQYLGTSGLILMFLIELKPQYRLIFALAIMIIHQYLLGTYLGDIIYDGIEGGIHGALSWISMMILSSILTEGLYNKKAKEFFLLGGIACIIIGSITNFIWGISRQRISLPFIFLSVGVTSLVFYSLYYIFEIWGKKYSALQKENFISALGRNAFVLFIFHIFLISIVIPLIPLHIEVLFVFIIGFVNTLIIWLLGFFFYKNEVFIKI